MPEPKPEDQTPIRIICERADAEWLLKHLENPTLDNEESAHQLFIAVIQALAERPKPK